jgi:hypothetical protein
MGGGFTQDQASDWREICYSGTVVTGGGLLFVEHSDRRLLGLTSAMSQSSGNS